jgi:GNAT superfamily N-acetyltransferase
VSGPQLSLRPADPVVDLAVFRRVVYTAATFRGGVEFAPVDELLATDHYAPYVTGWGRAGDRCILAELDGQPVGGAFSRVFAPPAVGDGFIDERTPELGIGLWAGHRSSGIGRALMQAIITQARLDAFDGISLGVADDNRAGELYESLGFQVHKVIKGGRIMLLPLKR